MYRRVILAQTIIQSKEILAEPGRTVWALGPLVPGFERGVAATGAHLEHRDIDPMAELVRVHINVATQLNKVLTAAVRAALAAGQKAVDGPGTFGRVSGGGEAPYAARAMLS